MDASVTVTARISLNELAARLAREMSISGEFTAATVDADVLVLTFLREHALEADEPASVSVVDPDAKKRLRTKRRGWEVVARIRNRKGQHVAVYRPFVEAIRGSDGIDQLALVRRILQDNGNAPTESTVRYYLHNTLDYLQQEGAVNQ